MIPESDHVAVDLRAAASKFIKPALQAIVFVTLAVSVFGVSYLRAVAESGTLPEGFRLTVSNVVASIVASGLPFLAIALGFFGLVFFRTWKKLLTLAAMILLALLLK